MNTTELLKTATDTYNGKTGCACGCGGSYANADSVAGKKRIAKIANANLGTVVYVPFSDGTGCLEIENKEGTRVVRIYVGKETK
jgi:hypothetical protein